MAMGNSAGRVRQCIDWVDAAGDLATGGLAMVRRLAEAVGTLTVIVGVAIVTMPSVRESTLQMARDLFTPEANAAPVESAGASSVDERDEVATGTLRLEPTDVSV